jgi:hypothetical protein
MKTQKNLHHKNFTNEVPNKNIQEVPNEDPQEVPQEDLKLKKKKKRR